MSIQRLLIVDSSLLQKDISVIQDCTQDNVASVTMDFSNLKECCGTIRGLVAGNRTFTYVGIVSHDKSLRDNSNTLLNAQFIKGLKGLFPLAGDRVNTGALDLFACTIDGHANVFV